jgi:hypothetical protein
MRDSLERQVASKRVVETRWVPKALSLGSHSEAHENKKLVGRWP